MHAPGRPLFCESDKQKRAVQILSRQSLCVQLAKLTLDGEEGGKEDLARRGKKIRTSLPKGEIIIRIYTTSPPYLHLDKDMSYYHIELREIIYLFSNF